MFYNQQDPLMNWLGTTGMAILANNNGQPGALGRGLMQGTVMNNQMQQNALQNQMYGAQLKQYQMANQMNQQKLDWLGKMTSPQTSGGSTPSTTTSPSAKTTAKQGVLTPGATTPSSTASSIAAPSATASGLPGPNIDMYDQYALMFNDDPSSIQTKMSNNRTANIARKQLGQQYPQLMNADDETVVEFYRKAMSNQLPGQAPWYVSNQGGQTVINSAYQASEEAKASAGAAKIWQQVGADKQTEWDKVRMKALQDTGKDFDAAGTAARLMEDQLIQLNGMLQDPNFETGPWEETKNQLRKVVAGLGIPIDEQAYADATTFKSYSNELTRTLLNAAKGPQTKEDQLFLQSIMPNYSNVTEANKELVNFYGAKSARDRYFAKAMSNVQLLGNPDDAIKAGTELKNMYNNTPAAITSKKDGKVINVYFSDYVGRAQQMGLSPSEAIQLWVKEVDQFRKAR